MKIIALSLKDFRGFHDLKINFDGKNAVFFGINGVGKTSILAAINILYAPIIHRIVNQRFKLPVNMELSDIKYGKAQAAVAADFVIGPENKFFPYVRSITYENQRVQDITQLSRFVEYYERLYVTKPQIDNDNNLIVSDEKRNIPIFVSYGVNRLVVRTPLRIRKGPDYGQYAAFERAIENQIAFGKLFEWFLEQELYENQQKQKDANYKDTSLEAVKHAMLAMLDGYKDIHIEVHPYSMKVTKGRDVLDILQLSDGEKCTLALFGDLARRLALANPSLNNPLLGQGVVLIDEIELHMHTEWQRKIMKVLSQTFPNIQFIVTTHSPQVLGELSPDCKVFSLKREWEECTCKEIPSTFGLDSNMILEDMLGTACINHEIKDKIRVMYEYIETGEYDKAEELADRIDEMTLGRNVDTPKARVLIRRGKRRNASNQ